MYSTKIIPILRYCDYVLDLCSTGGQREISNKVAECAEGINCQLCEINRTGDDVEQKYHTTERFDKKLVDNKKLEKVK